MIDIDNFAHLAKCLPGRVEQRNRDATRIVVPLIEELAAAWR
jgi:hypothetical protein